MGNKKAELLREQHWDRMRKYRPGELEERSDKRIKALEQREQRQPKVTTFVKNRLYKEFKELKEFNRDCSATQSGMQLGRDDAVQKETEYRRGGYGDRIRVRMQNIARILDPHDPTLRIRDKDRRPR